MTRFQRFLALSEKVRHGTPNKGDWRRYRRAVKVESRCRYTERRHAGYGLRAIGGKAAVKV